MRPRIWRKRPVTQESVLGRRLRPRLRRDGLRVRMRPIDASNV